MEKREAGESMGQCESDGNDKEWRLNPMGNGGRQQGAANESVAREDRQDKGLGRIRE